MSKPEEEPKLIIDEDWKTQVQREKEELKQKLAAEEAHSSSQASSSSTSPSPPTADTLVGNTRDGGETEKSTARENRVSEDSGAKSRAAGQAQDPSLPPASFTLLVTTLATQAMAAMGLMPAADGEASPPLNLDFAKHFIDMLSVLEDKTKGNLVDTEKMFLQDTLHQLRMAFVAMSKQR